jgi:predicted transcriptional regulator
MSGKRASLGHVLGSRQASILEYLWKMGPLAVTEIHKGLSSREKVAYTTIFTELNRMLAKGLVEKVGTGGSHLDVRYGPAVTREDVVSAAVSETLGGLISAHGAAAVHGFVDAVSHNPEALDELRRLLRRRPRSGR